MASDGVLVWDRPIRLFHWLLVGAVAASASTGFLFGMPALRVHLFAGVAVAGLLAGRVAWGLLGPTHARFTNFAFGPRAVVAHLRGRSPARHLGHNPLGAQMVFAFLLVLLALVATGTLALGGAFKQGPLAWTRFAAGWRALALHRAAAFGLLAMIVAHLAGVAFESRRSRENLIWAMLTGRKRAAGAAEQPVLPRPRAATLVLVCLAAAATLAVRGAPAARGLPPPVLDPTYDAACGSCHYTFSPSLNPAWVWDGILDHLGRHFGVAAPVSAVEAATIRRYLRANAAERWDTLAAHLFATRNPAEPWRITATPAWRRFHAGISAAVFASPAVSGRFSCNSCHADATGGRFAPQAIALPQRR